MGMFYMTNLEYESNEPTFKDVFKIGYFCPKNTQNIKFSFHKMNQVVDLDWATVFLAVGSKYLEYRSIFEYALMCLDDSSDAEIQELALMNYDDVPDCIRADIYIDALVKNITMAEWARAFLRLYFLSFLHFLENTKFNNKDYQSLLERIYIDYFYNDLGDSIVYLPFVSKTVLECLNNTAKEERIKKERVEIAAGRLKELNDIDIEGARFGLMLASVEHSWSHRGYDGIGTCNMR